MRLAGEIARNTAAARVSCGDELQMDAASDEEAQ
jgi:hypothetical protein